MQDTSQNKKKHEKHTKVLALVLAAVLMCTTMSSALAVGKSYEELLEEYEMLKSSLMTIDLHLAGMYEVKSSKLYGRKIIGIGGDGTFALGPWELLHSLEMKGGDIYTFYVPETYMAFAYSVDIFWGTDFPYSGVFWTNTEEPVTCMEIRTEGTIRSVDIDIKVNRRTVVHETDCSSHREWKP